MTMHISKTIMFIEWRPGRHPEALCHSVSTALVIETNGSDDCTPELIT